VILVITLIKRLSDNEPPFLTPEEQAVSGLPFYTDPSQWRFVLFLLIILPGSIFPFYLPDPFGYVVSFLIFVLASFAFKGFGAGEAEERWKLADKAERQKHVIAKQTLEARQLDEQRKLDEEAKEKAQYAPLHNPTPEEITETARRVAEKLKKA
jgi:hypothetical protein